MSEKVKQASYYCEKNGQEHLKEYLKPPFSEKAEKFAVEILGTDLAHINSLYKTVSVNKKIKFVPEIIPQNVFDLSKAEGNEKQELYDLGLGCLSRGEVAAITLAGGQGTRLGHSGPKGTFMLKSGINMSLFEIQCKRLKEISVNCGNTVPWLIMTSEENHDATLDFFKSNDFFGYDPKSIEIFPQGMLPLIDFEGKILVNNSQIAKGPDGNGGIFSQLEKSGNLEKLKAMNIKKVFICGIDNPLVKMADPSFIGYSIKTGSEIACKSVIKRSWNEKAGVFCKKDNKPFYVEYTDIPEEKAKSVDENGMFLFGDIGIVMYVYDINMLEKIAEKKLPYHEARKKIPYTLPTGEKIEPKEPNGIKYETFIFDSFNFTDNVSVLRVLREEEFAPVKNKSGEDSPGIAEKLYNENNK